ncbi:MAG: radical SAM/SPASM domain-containing protein [bacterium]
MYRVDEDIKIKENEKSQEDYKGLFTPYKILFHKNKIIELQKTGTTFPVAFDIDLTNMCNHKCPLCNGSREAGARDCTHQNFDRLKDLIREIKQLGACSVTFGGGGDPSVYPHFTEALRFTKAQGLDIGVYTNGQALNEESMSALVECCTWIRVSLDADGPQIYEIAHGVPGTIFFQIVDNIQQLVNIKKARHSDVTIGTCYLIGPKTIPGVYRGTQISHDLGVDYIRIRPYFQKPGDRRTVIEIDDTLKILEKCKDFETDSFTVSYPHYRIEWMDDKNRIRKYKKCYGVHFMASVTPDGNVYPCCHFKNIPGMEIGNIHTQSFKKIWYKESRKNLSNTLRFTHCPNPCNFEKHNEFLGDFMESHLPLDEYLTHNALEEPHQAGIHKNFL